MEYASFALIVWACTAIGAAAITALWLGVPAGLVALVLVSVVVGALLAVFYRGTCAVHTH